MAKRFQGKIAVIIGGSSGIGLASARAFAREGASVVISGRDVSKSQYAIQAIGHEATYYPCDLSSVSQIEAFFAAVRGSFGRIDILFVSAGVLAFAPVDRVTEADWDWLQNTNLKGTFFTVQKALPLMSVGSAVVLAGSTAGRQAVPTASVYGASKAGVRSLGRTFAAELLPRGIRVNVVSPGPTDTPIFACARGLSEDSVEDQRQAEIESVPMKRMGTPDEVAAAVLFLASEDAAFITGTELLVAGGAASF